MMVLSGFKLLVHKDRKGCRDLKELPDLPVLMG